MLSSFRYHNEPEGHNLKDKISSLVRIGAIIGTYKSGLNIIFDDAPKRTIGQSLSLIVKNVGMPMAVGFTYALARYTITNFRKKEDLLNPFLAGAVNAPLFYGWWSHRLYKEARIIVLLPILLGAGAMLLETAWEFTTLNPEEYQGSMIRVPGRPRTYSTWMLE